MPMAGVRGGERLRNDDSRLALCRPVGVLSPPVENRPVRRSDQIDGVLATLPRGFPSARETDQSTDSALARHGTVRLVANCQPEEIRDHSRSRQENGGKGLALDDRGLGNFSGNGQQFVNAQGHGDSMLGKSGESTTSMRTVTRSCVGEGRVRALFQ